MVMLELLSGLAPAAADPKAPGRIVYHINDVLAPNKPGAMDRCMRGLDPTAGWPAQPANELATLALKCVNEFDESQRPNFVTVVRTIRSIGERFPKPSVPQTLLAQVPQVPQQLMGANPYIAQQGMVQAAAAPAAAAAVRPQHPSASAGKAAPAVPAPNADPQPIKVSAKAPVDAPYALELAMAVGIEASALPTERRYLPLVPASASADIVAPVGRQHQPEFFETWIPDENLRGCISRTAFEVLWTASGESLRLQARGANPVSVNGQIVPRDAAVPVRLGSEIAFTYAASGEQSVFLLLRLLQGSRSQAASAPAQGGVVPMSAPRMQPSSAMSVAAAPAAAKYASPDSAPVVSVTPKQPQADGKATQAAPGRAFEPPAREAPKDWCLQCIHAEGMSGAALAALPPDVQFFPLSDGVTTIGRQHQPLAFEALLAEAPSCLSFISRTHVQLSSSASGLTAANMSSNPIYVDREHLAKGESCMLKQSQIVSFARLEGGSHVYFLRYQVSTQARDNAARQGAGPSASSPSRPLMVPATIDARGTSPDRKGLNVLNEISPPQLAKAGAYAATQPSSSPSPAGSAFDSPEKKRPGPASTASSPLKPHSNESQLPPRPGAPPTEMPQPGKCKTADDLEIILELSGDGVLDVPLAERSIGPLPISELPLLVGRKHQPELHRRAVSKDCLQFLSRDHFRISFEGGEFKMLVMTSNPIWRDRNGQCSAELTRGDIISLTYGDRIALGTGGEAASPDDAQRSLCWLLRSADKQYGAQGGLARGFSPSRQGAGHGTPPSPGGAGPRPRGAPGNTFEPMLPPVADLMR
mmetsp:Transcript_26914/g.68395  ORF Transcript_26914/g.68395 Transcript_26914/m.68395 type:complete len:815 (+) Transcript_26914:3-2447(+)